MSDTKVTIPGPGAAMALPAHGEVRGSGRREVRGERGKTNVQHGGRKMQEGKQQRLWLASAVFVAVTVSVQPGVGQQVSAPSPLAGICQTITREFVDLLTNPPDSVTRNFVGGLRPSELQMLTSVSFRWFNSEEELRLFLDVPPAAPVVPFTSWVYVSSAASYLTQYECNLVAVVLNSTNINDGGRRVRARQAFRNHGVTSIVCGNTIFSP